MNIDRKNGFSLVELLVVIAIISILVTLLVPAISRSIATAKRVKCSNNMRNIAQAWALYAADEQGRLCSSETGGADCWVVGRGGRDEARIGGIKAGKLWPYLNDLDVYRCPGTYGFMKNYLRNYSFSGMVGSGGHSRWKNMSHIRYPDTTLLLVEDFDWRNFNMGSWLCQSRGWYYWVDYLPGNHLGGDNFVFCDGHVEYRRYEDPETLSVYDPRHFYLPDPDGKNPDLDWIGRRYKANRFYSDDGRLNDQYINNPPWN